MINQLSYVTRKLQHNTLDEAVNIVSKITSDDHDSGTESDDEQTFDETEIASEMSSEMSSGCSVRSRPTSQTSTDTLTCEEIPSSGGDAPDMTSSPAATLPPTADAVGPLCTFHHPRRPARHNYQLRTPTATSIETACSVFEDTTDPVEHHSSEEELETLTGDWSPDNGPPSEKRKWSQVARLSVTDSGSSDDEVCVLTTGTQPPVEFRTSPPIEAHKPLRSASPPSKMLNLTPMTHHHHHHHHHGAFGLPGAEGVIAPLAIMNGVRAASPRKRHRHTTRPHRPCLDFEKMQQMKNRAVTRWRNGGELSLSFF